MNAIDFLRSSTEDSKIQYPILLESVDRIQVILAHNTYGLALFNHRTKSWCGYTLLNQGEAESSDSWRHIVGASYLAPANDPITWMIADRAGNLTLPVTIQTSQSTDFWIGFHTESQPEIDERLNIVHQLGTFVVSVKKALSTYANPAL